MPGPPHSEPPRWPGQTSRRVGQRQQRVVQRAEDAARALVLVDGEVGPRDVADEQGVAGQHGPRLVAARGVDERERGVLGAVAGRVQRAHAQRAELELPAVVERLVVVVGRGVAVDVDRRAGGGGQPPVAGDVVGVVVGLEDVLDAHADVAREAQVLVDVEPRVDDRGDARVLVADQVARAAEVVVGELAEDHRTSATPRATLPVALAASARAGGRRRRVISVAQPRVDEHVVDPGVRALVGLDQLEAERHEAPAADLAAMVGLDRSRLESFQSCFSSASMSASLRTLSSRPG